MSKLPMVNSKTMDKILHHLGFAAVRQKGSHVFYRHADGRTTTLPNHGNRDLARSCARFCVKYPFRPMSSWNYSKRFSLEPNTLQKAGYIFLLKHLRQQPLKQGLHLPLRH
jgi:predicted RNA binding protein YcfA (HicA-like mRNA interferase family)